MAHFAQLNEKNEVIAVHAVSNDVLDTMDEEGSGIAFLIEWSQGHQLWKQTSYNAQFRKNYAGIGYRYDSSRDAFIPPKIFNSWILNEVTCQWEPPIPCPVDGNKYEWNDIAVRWEKL